MVRRGRGGAGRRPRPLPQARVWLASARFAPPEEALSLARGACTLARANDLGGVEIAASVRAAQALLALRRPGEAATQARAAEVLLRTLDSGIVTRGEALLTLARALAAAGEDGAPQARARAEEWARETAERHVPPEFRTRFLEGQLAPPVLS